MNTLKKMMLTTVAVLVMGGLCLADVQSRIVEPFDADLIEIFARESEPMMVYINGDRRTDLDLFILTEEGEELLSFALPCVVDQEELFDLLESLNEVGAILAYDIDGPEGKWPADEAVTEWTAPYTGVYYALVVNLDDSFNAYEMEII